ncbi:MAG: molybdopterin-dependent oxidoreductase [Luminiphilus sp.]
MSKNNEKPKPQFHYRTCHLCETMCGIEVEHDGKDIIAIRGDKRDVLSKGNICPKAIGLQDIHTDPDRLRKPLIRIRKDPTQKQAEDGWREVEWPEAIDFAAAGVAAIQSTHGRASAGSYCGRSTAHNIGALLGVNLLRNGLGTRHIYTGSTCDQIPHNFAWHHMLGHQFFATVPDVDRTDYFLMLGTNPKISNGAMMSTGANTYKKLNAIRARGGKVVLLDPRKSETAPYCDEHFFIAPNTDALLLIGLIKTLIDEQLTNLGRLEPHIVGLESISAMVDCFDIDSIATATGVTTTDIARIAREFAASKTAVCYGRTGVSMVEFGGLCLWLIMVLNIITGNLDKRGGLMFPRNAIDALSSTSSSYDRYRSRVRQRPEFGGEFPMAILADEILTAGEGQLRALIAVAGNMVLSMANGHHTEKALAELDFMVSIDPYLNETTRFADVILPPAGPFEKQHYDLFYHTYDTLNWAKYSPVLFSSGDSVYTDYEIISELMEGIRRRQEKSVFKRCVIRLKGALSRRFLTVDRIIDLGLRFGPYGAGLNPFKRGALSLKRLKRHPHGIFLGELEPCLPQRLFTKDKTVRLSPQPMLDDLPRLKDHLTSLTASQDEPATLKMISRLTNRTLGWMHHSHRLVKGRNPVELMINPVDAATREISANTLVEISSSRGAITVPVKITEDIMPGVVCLPHLWGHNRPGTRQRTANASPGASYNDLTGTDIIDELTGNAIFNGVEVTVSPAGIAAPLEAVHEDESIEEYGGDTLTIEASI